MVAGALANVGESQGQSSVTLQKRRPGLWLLFLCVTPWLASLRWE